MAVPGSVVGVGKLITPGGQQGPKGDAGSTAALADITQNGLLRQTPGTTTTFVDGTNNYQPIVPQITAVRLRSYNSLGNPSMEVSQRSAGTAVAMTPALGGWVDRWGAGIGGTAVTLRTTSQQIATNVAVPGTSYYITSSVYRITLTTAQASLGSDNTLLIWHSAEGPALRELLGDVHSASILCRSSVANLKFGLIISDSTNTRALAKLCTLGAANTFTLITLPNLPVFPGAGVFPVTPGSVGYNFVISLAAGSGQSIPVDTWQTTSMYGGAVGQSNFAASAVNSTFDIAFVQHEPGSICTTLQDLPFSANLDQCLRYYQKTYLYGTTVGTIANAGIRAFIATGAITAAFGPLSFSKIMAKIPTLTLYNHATGTAGSVRDLANTDHASATAGGVGDAGFYSMTFTTATSAVTSVMFHYTADTGL